MTVIALSQQKGQKAVRGLKHSFHITMSWPTLKALTTTYITISKGKTWKTLHIKYQQINGFGLNIHNY